MYGLRCPDAIAAVSHEPLQAHRTVVFAVAVSDVHAEVEQHHKYRGHDHRKSGVVDFEIESQKFETLVAHPVAAVLPFVFHLSVFLKHQTKLSTKKINK